MLVRALFLSLAIIIVSCDNKEPFEDVDVNQVKSNLNLPLDLGDAPASSSYVLGHLVDEGLCYNMYNVAARSYSISVTSGLTTTSYNRTVHVAVVKGQNILTSAILTIPAGQTQSQNIPVFESATTRHGTVSVIPYTVFNGSQDITDQHELRKTSTVADNCYNSNSNLPGLDFCGDDNDHDNDGVCNNIDSDYEDLSDLLAALAAASKIQGD